MTRSRPTVRSFRSLATAAAALVTGVPAVALACPSCAGREGPGVGTLLAVAAMIGVPYVVATVVLQVVRRLDQGPDGPQGGA